MATKDEDYTETVFSASTHDNILLFTNRGRVYIKKGYQIPEAGRNARGTNIVNILQIEPDEKISAMICGRGIDTGSYLVFVTRNGTVKRMEQAALKNIRASGIRALTLEEGDQLISVLQTAGDEQIFIGTHRGMAVCFNETDVRATGRTAIGVRGIRLRDGDFVVGAGASGEGYDVLSITEKGYGKRTDLGEYSVHGRGGVGIRNYSVTEKTGPVAAIKMVGEDDDLLVITNDGTIIRTPVERISRLGRATQGVRVMRLMEGSRVIDIEKTEPARDEEIPEDGEDSEE